MTPLLAVLALQVLRGREAVDPAVYASRSGVYELRVEASRVDGSGEGVYRLQRSGSEVWSGIRPFTLLDARVGEDGRTVGYALTEGEHGLGQLCVVILDAAGAVVLDERHERAYTLVNNVGPDPKAVGVLMFEGSDVCVLRAAQPLTNHGKESWWVYRTSTGERIDAFVPVERLGLAERSYCEIHDAETLAGMDLVLLGGLASAEGRSGVHDQWFALLKPGGEPVWSVVDPGALSGALGGLSGYRLVHRVRERGAVLSSGPAGCFRLWRVGQAAAVDYRVERALEAEHGWQVTEVARRPDEGLAEPATEPERVALKHLGSVALARGSASDEILLGPVAAWAFDVDGGLRIVRTSGQGVFEHLRVDRGGRILGATPFQPLPAEHEGPRLWAHLGGERWLLAVNPHGSARARAYFADGATGTLEELWKFKSPEVEACAPAPGGGFALLATHDLSFTRQRTVIVFEGDGRERWRKTEPLPPEDADAASIAGACDVAVLADGSVAVLTQTPDSIAFFDPAGAFVGRADLALRWGEEPNYLSGIEPAPGDALLVHDFNGTPPLRLVERDGTVRARLDPVRADGHTEPALVFSARFAPDGELWTCDGNRFYRLDGAGREVAALGAAPSAEVLHEVGATALDALGRVCVQDERNGVLHVWGADGVPLLTAVPEPADFERVDSSSRIVAGSDGGFAVEARRERHVLFDAAGRRTGRLEEPRALDFAPGTGASWAWPAHGEVELRTADGEVRRLARLPSGRWITKPEDVCPLADGSFAVLADHEVGLFDAAGQPLQSFGLPGAPGLLRMATVGPAFLQTVSAGSRWILVSGFERDAWLIDRQGGAPRLFQAAEVGEERTCEMALSPRGDEVLVLDERALVLHRYALP